MTLLSYLIKTLPMRAWLFAATLLCLDLAYLDILRKKLEQVVLARKAAIAAKGAPPVFRKDGQVHNFSISGTTRTDFLARRAGKPPAAPAHNVSSIAGITEYTKPVSLTADEREKGPIFPFVDPTDTGTLWLVRAKYKEEHLARRLQAANALLKHNQTLQSTANNRFEQAKILCESYPDNKNLAYERDVMGADLFLATKKVSETAEYVKKCEADHAEAEQKLQAALGLDTEIPTNTNSLGYDPRIGTTTAKFEGKL